MEHTFKPVNHFKSVYCVRKTLTSTDSDSTNVNETSFWETQCELKVATHVCQCGQVERTRMSDRADVGINDGTQTRSLFC